MKKFQGLNWIWILDLVERRVCLYMCVIISTEFAKEG